MSAVGSAGPARGAGAGSAHRSPAHRDAGWGKDAAVVARAVLPHPGLWWAAMAAVLRLARRGWWRRPPFVPLPGDAYWRFRLVTAYGGDGERGALAASDVVAYLRWCQRSRPRRG